MNIIPVRPEPNESVAVTVTPVEARETTSRRTFGISHPSRRTFGINHP